MADVTRVQQCVQEAPEGAMVTGGAMCWGSDSV